VLPQEHDLRTTCTFQVWGDAPLSTTRRHLITQSTTASTLCSPVSPIVGSGERTRGGLVATWFGRSRVQERAEDSEDTSVVEDGRNGSTHGSTEAEPQNDARENDAPENAAPENAAPLYATNTDVRSL